MVFGPRCRLSGAPGGVPGGGRPELGGLRLRLLSLLGSSETDLEESANNQVPNR